MKINHPTSQIIKNLDELHGIANFLNSTAQINQEEARTAKYYIKQIDILLNNK